MNIFKRILVVASSLVAIGFYVFMLFQPERGCYYALDLLATTLLCYGIQQIWYYFTMSRFKVGGNSSLYIGIACLDMAVLSYSLSGIPSQLVMLYLLLYYIVYGILHIYSAIEARKLDAPSWRIRLLNGSVGLLISVLCLLNFSSKRMMVYILCFGLIYSAVMQIITVCRHTSMIYFQ